MACPYRLTPQLLPAALASRGSKTLKIDTQELIDQLNEEIYQWGYQGYAQENLDGDTRTLELHLEAPDGTQLDRPGQLSGFYC